MDSHLIGNDAAQRRLSQAWRAVKKYVVQSFPSGLCGVDKYFQRRLDLFLANIIGKELRS